MLTRRAKNLATDALILAASVLFAVFLAKSNLLIDLLSRTHDLSILGSFVAGLFFTSAFTVAPAAATLGELALRNPLWEVALAGGLGAMFGDLVIFRFVRDRLSAHLEEYLEMVGGTERLRTFLTKKSTRWFSWVLGAVLIASPVPDEFAIALLGASRMRPLHFLLVSLVFNAMGVALVGLAARAL